MDKFVVKTLAFSSTKKEVPTFRPIWQLTIEQESTSQVRSTWTMDWCFSRRAILGPFIREKISRGLLWPRCTKYAKGTIYTNIQLFWERLSEKVHATILKGIVGDFKCTVFQRNLKESYGRPLIYVCECWRKVTKVGSTATVVSNSVLIISHITFRDCRVHFILDKLSRNICIYPVTGSH